MKDNNMKDNKASHSLAKGVAGCMVIAVIFTGAYFMFFKGPKEVGGAINDGTLKTANAGYDLVKRAAKDISKALEFTPQVTIGHETVYGPAAQIEEITTASKDFTHTYTFEDSFLHSTKRLKIKGEFTAKAGFPVDGFIMEVSEDGSKVTLRHKEPKLLSCELKKISIIDDENGWWNKLKPEHREDAQNELLRAARERALDDDLKATAIEKLKERLLPLQDKYSFTTESEVLP